MFKTEFVEKLEIHPVFSLFFSKKKNCGVYEIIRKIMVVRQATEYSIIDTEKDALSVTDN